MDADDGPISACPHCGAPLDGHLATCPVCRKWLADDLARPRSRVPWRYDLASVMIFIMVVAVGLGLSLRLETAGIGVPVLLLGPPIVLRTAPIFVNRRREGQVGRSPGLSSLVFESLLISGTLLVAGSIAFVAVCLPVGCMTTNLYGPSPYLWTAFVLGGLAACLVLYRIGRRTFPPRD